MTDRLDGLRVLVVDDNDDGRFLLTVSLQMAGASATAVADSDEALAIVHVHTPDVIVSDRDMPGKTGLDLVREVRAHEAESGARTAMILVTGASDEDCLGAHRAGFDDCLRRPFDANAPVESVLRTTGRGAA